MANLFEAQNAADIRQCLERGDNIEESIDDITPFIYHCKTGNVECVLELVKNGCNILEADYNFRMTGFIYACYKGHFNLVKELLNLDIFVELIDNSTYYYTPLIAACEKGRTDIFDILIAYDANPNCPTDNRKTTPLITACMYNQIDIVDKLLSLGVDVNLSNYEAQTAIFYIRSADMINKLYLHGANINRRDIFGETPLNRFVFYHDAEIIVESLINYGADVNIPNKHGETPLIKFISKRQPNKESTHISYISYISYINRMVTLLVKGGANTQIRDKYNHTAYDYAIKNSYYDILDILQPK